MGQTTDVFVIGGGPAGLAAAIAARKRGFAVTLADGAQPPIDKACGEGLMPDSLAALHRLGIAVNSADGFSFSGIRFLDPSGVPVDACFPFGQGIGLRRLLLHQKLIERAEQLGVTLLWKTCVTRLAPNGVFVGRDKIVSAHWVIAADGMRSRMRRWAGLNGSGAQQPRFAFRSHYRVRPWADYMEVYWGRNAQACVTPVSSEEVCVVLMSKKPWIRAETIPGTFPLLAQRLAGAQMTAERGELTLTRSFHRVYRGRVALIGDASGTVDAITGEGLRLSFQQAEALAEAIESGDMASYQAAHRGIARRPALMSRLLLFLDAHQALRRRTMHAFAAHPELFRRLLSVHIGTNTSVGHLAGTGALLGWRLVTT